MAKIYYGIKKLHVAKLLNAEENTFDTPKPLKGAVALSLTPGTKQTPFYGDDDTWITLTTVGKQEGELEVYYIEEDMQKYLFGHFYSQNNLLVETNKVDVEKFALIGQYSTDDKKRCFCIYLVSVTRPAFELKTTAEDINPNTQKIKITVEPIEVNGYDDKVFKTTIIPEDNQEVAKTWFSKVTLPTGRG